MAQSDLLLIFMLRHRRPQVFRPPRTMLMADPELVRDAEQTRRIRGMTTEEIEAELAEIERRRAFAEAARAEADARRGGMAAAG